jgi:predicted GTPase
MRKVEMIRGKRVVVVDQRLAPLLEKHSGYLRRDMVAQLPVANPEPANRAAPKAVAKKATAKKAAPKKDATE